MTKLTPAMITATQQLPALLQTVITIHNIKTQKTLNQVFWWVFFLPCEAAWHGNPGLVWCALTLKLFPIRVGQIEDPKATDFLPTLITHAIVVLLCSSNLFYSFRILNGRGGVVDAVSPLHYWRAQWNERSDPSIYILFSYWQYIYIYKKKRNLHSHNKWLQSWARL